MPAAVNMLVCKDPAPRYHGALKNLGMRPAIKFPNWYIIIDDRKPGARENRVRLNDRMELYSLAHSWRPLRTSKRRYKLPRRREVSP